MPRFCSKTIDVNAMIMQERLINFINNRKPQDLKARKKPRAQKTTSATEGSLHSLATAAEGAAAAELASGEGPMSQPSGTVTDAPSAQVGTSQHLQQRPHQGDLGVEGRKDGAHMQDPTAAPLNIEQLQGATGGVPLQTLLAPAAAAAGSRGSSAVPNVGTSQRVLSGQGQSDSKPT